MAVIWSAAFSSGFDRPNVQGCSQNRLREPSAPVVKDEVPAGATWPSPLPA